MSVVTNVITVIARIRGKTRTVLNQFFTRRREDEETKLPHKILTFLAKK